MQVRTSAILAAAVMAVAVSGAQAAQVTTLSENFSGALGGSTGSSQGANSFTVGSPVNTTWYENHWGVSVDKSQGNALSVNYGDANGFRAIRGVWNGGADYVRLGTTVGEKVTFSFDFFYLQADANNQYGNGSNAIRFGLFNNGGTNPSGDSQGNFTTGLADDTGFWGAGNRNDTNSGGSSTTAGGGLLWYSTNAQPVYTGSGVNLNVIIGDTNTHAVKIVLERTAASTVKYTAFLDNTELNSTTATHAGNFDANEVAFWSAVSDGSSTKITYDNIQITAVPEPMSLSLLGLGGLALLRRRRA